MIIYIWWPLTSINSVSEHYIDFLNSFLCPHLQYSVSWIMMHHFELLHCGTSCPRSFTLFSVLLWLGWQQFIDIFTVSGLVEEASQKFYVTRCFSGSLPSQSLELAYTGTHLLGIPSCPAISFPSSFCRFTTQVLFLWGLGLGQWKGCRPAGWRNNWFWFPRLEIIEVPLRVICCSLGSWFGIVRTLNQGYDNSPVRMLPQLQHICLFLALHSLSSEVPLLVQYTKVRDCQY